MTTITKSVDVHIDDYEVEIEVELDEVLDESDVDEVLDLFNDVDAVQDWLRAARRAKGVAKWVASDSDMLTEVLRHARDDLDALPLAQEILGAALVNPPAQEQAYFVPVEGGHIMRIEDGAHTALGFVIEGKSRSFVRVCLPFTAFDTGLVTCDTLAAAKQIAVALVAVHHNTPADQAALEA